MRYNSEEEIKDGIYEVMNIFELDRMPTSKEVRCSGLSGLEAAITRTGGYIEWSKKTGLGTKGNITKWHDEKIRKEIIRVKNILNLDRMPNSGEIRKTLGDESLHGAITKHGGYDHWANALGLEQKDSETQTGKRFEKHAAKTLIEKGYVVEEMSLKHPFDLLVNNSIKIDVKVGRAYLVRGSRIHTFGINKKFATCDLYMIFALDERDEVERLLIIPSHLIKMTSLNVGKDSVYNKYIDRWDYLEKFNEFYKAI